MPALRKYTRRVGAGNVHTGISSKASSQCKVGNDISGDISSFVGNDDTVLFGMILPRFLMDIGAISAMIYE